MQYFDVAAWEAAGRHGTITRERSAVILADHRRRVLQYMVRTAAQNIIDARHDGMLSTALATLTDRDDDCLDLSDGFDPSWDSLHPSRLRGPWAILRDELQDSGIKLAIALRPGPLPDGRECRWAFDIGATWSQ